MVHLRESILLRDNYQCRICHIRDGRLEVHHIRHEKSKPEEIISLCKECHIIFHQIERALKKGARGYYHCSSCEKKSIMLDYQWGRGKRIIICSNCLAGTFSERYRPRALFKGYQPYLMKLKEYLESIGIGFDSEDLIHRHDSIPLNPRKNENELERMLRINDETSYTLSYRHGVKVYYEPTDILDIFSDILKDSKLELDDKSGQYLSLVNEINAFKSLMR